MRNLNVKIIEDTIAEMAVDVNYHLGSDVCTRLEESRKIEKSQVACGILKNIEKNIRIADEGVYPLCQDTGMACVFMEVGQEVALTGGLLEDAVNRGVKRGYEEGYLRKSIVADPLIRKNTGDNTPAAVYYKITGGDKVKITFAAKGFGSENMSRIKMLPPSAGEQGVKDFVVQTCEDAGANPCPPMVVGVGIGGNFDKVALLAKEALLIPFDQSNSDDRYKVLEEELLERINDLGIGPQGLGGRTTALAVKIKTAPTHIAGLPVAVNINCHVSRHKEVII